MTARGRGCLEVRPSDNPFFQPMSADFGKTAQDTLVEWKVSGSPPKFSSKKHQVDGNFMFLYTRESDRIGQKVAKPEMSETKMLSRTEFLRKRRERTQSELIDGEEGELEHSPSESQTVEKVSAEELLKIYKHEPKQEDPRYITSASEYGKKPPSLATIVTERATRKQAFSKSFNNVKPKNTSLTTALTKSNVHSTLDPQFA